MYPRTLPLEDESVIRGTWHERMNAGEYAVHFSHFPADDYSAPYCTVFATLPDAEAYARQRSGEQPTLRCTIYDHQGFVGAPIRDIRGSAYKDKEGLSPLFRRWAGSTLFFSGVVLTIIDWHTDFRLGWPAMIGTRILVPGLALLLIEAVVLYTAKEDRKVRTG